jgi:hypothetical protein
LRRRLALETHVALHEFFVADHGDKIIHGNIGVSAEVLGVRSLKSSVYMRRPKLICFKLFMQVVRFVFAFARPNAGNNSPARMAMMAMTTNNSTKLKPGIFERFCFPAIYVFRMSSSTRTATNSCEDLCVTS